MSLKSFAARALLALAVVGTGAASAAAQAVETGFLNRFVLTLAAVDKAIAEFNGDRTRVYLTGLSAGGNGSWYLASHYPERFAAVVVVCGFISEFRGTTSGVLYPALAPESAADPFAAIAKRVSSLPIWIFHGDADPTVSVDQSRRMAAALKAVGANVQYTELPGVGHNAWDLAYDRADLIVWLLQQRRR